MEIEESKEAQTKQSGAAPEFKSTDNQPIDNRPEKEVHSKRRIIYNFLPPTCLLIGGLLGDVSNASYLGQNSQKPS